MATPARSRFPRRVAWAAALSFAALTCAAPLVPPADAAAERDADAFARRLDPPRPMFINLADGGRLAGHVTAFDEVGLRVEPKDGEPRSLNWDAIAPGEINRVYRRLLTAVDDRPAALVELAVVLRDIDDADSRLAELALRQAVRLDPDYEDQANAVRKGERARRRPEPPRDSGDGSSPTGPPGEESAAPPGVAGEDGEDHGPRISGQANAEYWGVLSDEVMQASVEDRKAFMQDAQQELNHRLRLHETDYFLFYSDLHPKEAERWAGLLDKMYRRLAELFAVEDNRNIFRGKAVVVVFRRAVDYHRFQSVVHHTQSTGSAGMCHGFGDGHVHIAFYRQDNDWLFAHILVHEAVHGFVHRYRSPIHVPSWVNEGLAEYIATQLVPQARVRQQRLKTAQEYLRHFRSFGGMFHAPHIQGWHYGVALDFTEYMIGQSKRRYADFVDGIKDGLTWEESLVQRYGVNVHRLIDAYERTLHMRDLSM